MSGLLSPILDSEILKPLEVGQVESDEVFPPDEGSRTPSKASGPTSRRDRSTVSRNARSASQNLSLPAARRRHSLSESMTTTGSNSSTIAVRLCWASAIEYRLDTMHSPYDCLDSCLIEGRVAINDRWDGEPKVSSNEDFVCVEWETMWLKHISLWLLTADRMVEA